MARNTSSGERPLTKQIIVGRCTCTSSGGTTISDKSNPSQWFDDLTELKAASYTDKDRVGVLNTGNNIAVVFVYSAISTATSQENSGVPTMVITPTGVAGAGRWIEEYRNTEFATKDDMEEVSMTESTKIVSPQHLQWWLDNYINNTGIAYFGSYGDDVLYDGLTANRPKLTLAEASSVSNIVFESEVSSTLTEQINSTDIINLYAPNTKFLVQDKQNVLSISGSITTYYTVNSLTLDSIISNTFTINNFSDGISFINAKHITKSGNSPVPLYHGAIYSTDGTLFLNVEYIVGNIVIQDGATVYIKTKSIIGDITVEHGGTLYIECLYYDTSYDIEEYGVIQGKIGVDFYPSIAYISSPGLSDITLLNDANTPIVLFSATEYTAGLLSAADKVKLDSLSTGINPNNYKGTITVNTDFPLLASVTDGDWYLIDTATITDNNPTYTNTGQTFTQDQTIFWGTDQWYLFSASSSIITDSTANNSKIFYSDNSGVINEIALGTDKQLLSANGTNGTTNPPTFENIDSSYISGFETSVHNTTNVTTNTLARHTRNHSMTSISDHNAQDWRMFYSDADGYVKELSLATAEQILTSNGADQAPLFKAKDELWIDATETHTGTTYNVDFSVDCSVVTLGANITGLTFSNLSSRKPVLRIFVSNGAWSLTLTGTGFTAFPNSEELSIDSGIGNWVLFAPKTITSSSEDIRFNNTLDT